MKKILIMTITGLFFIVCKIKAQNAEFGIKGGLNVSNLHSSATDNLDPRASVYLGGLTHIHLNKYWALSAVRAKAKKTLETFVEHGWDINQPMSDLEPPILQ